MDENSRFETDGFTIMEPRKGGDAWESDSLNGGKDPIEVEADGWLAYGNGVSECPYKYYQDLARHHAWNKGWWGAHQEAHTSGGGGIAT